MVFRRFLFAVLFVLPLFSAFYISAVMAKEFSLKEIRFSKEMWGEEFLMLLDKGPKYLTKDEPFFTEPPLRNDSEETKKEMEFLIKLQKENRDEKTVGLINQEVPKGVFSSIFSRDGIITFIGKNEKVEDVMLEAVEEAGYFLLREKMKFTRARPFQLAPILAPELTTVVETPAHSSYPSGHAGQSYAGALILGMIDPDNAEKYKKIAIDVGFRREIAGVHYPSDSEAGRLLAEQVVNKLMENKKFKFKFDRAKQSFEQTTK